MEVAIAIGVLGLLVVLAVVYLVREAKSGATDRAAVKAMKEVIDAGKRFNAARRDSAGLSRRERVTLMLQELRARRGSKVSGDE
jgi:hypothetical protein